MAPTISGVWTRTGKTQQVGVRVDLSDFATMRRLINSRGGTLADFVKSAIREKLEREDLRSSKVTTFG